MWLYFAVIVLILSCGWISGNHSWLVCYCRYRIWVYNLITIICQMMSVYIQQICVNNLTSVGSDNVLSPGRRQAIIWNNVGRFSNGPWETNFSEILIINVYIFIQENAFKNAVRKLVCICLGLNVIIQFVLSWHLYVFADVAMFN